MNKNKDNFFSRMKHSDNPAFEISMFSISIAVALFVLIAVIVVAYFYIKGQSSHYTDEEVNAGTVTEAAVEVDKEDSEPAPTNPPDGDVIINEDNIFEDDELKDAEQAYTTSTVNLRSEASLTATVLLKIPSGEIVKMVSYDGKDWAKVSYKGQEGYVSAMYLSVSKPAPIVMTPVQTSTERPKATATPKPTKKPRITEEPDESDEPEETDAPDYTEEPAPTEAPATEEPAPTEAPPEPTEAPPEPTEEPPAPEE